MTLELFNQRKALKNHKLSESAKVASTLRIRDESGKWSSEKTRIEDRFWPKVDKNGPVPSHCPELGPCWIWTGALNAKGYGKLGNERAHRVSWHLEHGQLKDSQLVLHKCDNRRCVRPTHLFDGSPQDNTDDMFNKRRNAHKGNAAVSRLTEEQIRWIRAAKAAGCVLIGFSKKYNVANSTVYRIANSTGKQWW